MSLRVTLTGASGLIGGALLERLTQRGDEVTVLTRGDGRSPTRPGIDAHMWDPLDEAAPVDALAGTDAVVHLAGEPIAKRWSESVKRAIRASRVQGTENLVAAIAACEPQQRPGVLVCASAVGYYGAHGEEPIDEEAPPGRDFLAQVCVAWEAAAHAAAQHGLRVVCLRTGVVLSRTGGALAQMLPPFRLGLGGPIAGGGQYISWIHLQDVLGIVLSAIEDQRFTGALNACAPSPVTNREFSRALGDALHRPAALSVPGLLLRARYGEMAQILTTGARVLPAKALVLGYEFRYPQLEQALGELFQ